MQLWGNIVALASLLSLGLSLDTLAQEGKPAGLAIRQDDIIPMSNETAIAEMTYEGPAFPSGTQITLTGTAEAIYAKLLELNPNYDTDFATEIAANMAADPEDDDSVSGLDARSWHGNCHLYTDRVCIPRQVRSGIHYLHKLTGSCGLQARTCTRVSCDLDAGIYACTAGGKRKVCCDRIAHLAHRIVKHCKFDVMGEEGTSGRDFSGDGWATDVAGTSC
ncbi:hypothetical protein F5884DRAFT_810219 [Xylogone sp. PMI_703]|nr:hypothetical protein F5884DRAFT_810219 [Xylogone sp. PMI_703]